MDTMILGNSNQSIQNFKQQMKRFQVKDDQQKSKSSTLLQKKNSEKAFQLKKNQRLYDNELKETYTNLAYFLFGLIILCLIITYLAKVLLSTRNL